MDLTELTEKITLASETLRLNANVYQITVRDKLGNSATLVTPYISIGKPDYRLEIISMAERLLDSVKN